MLCPQLIAPGMCLAGLLAVRGRRLPWRVGAQGTFLVSCFELLPWLSSSLGSGTPAAHQGLGLATLSCRVLCLLLCFVGCGCIE